MFFKKPLQNITMQYILLFLLAGLSLWHFLSDSNAGLRTGFCFLMFICSAVLLLLMVWHQKLAETRKFYPAILMLLLPQTLLADATWQVFLVLFLLCGLYYTFLFSVFAKNFSPNSEIIFGIICGMLGYLYAPLVLLLLFIYALLASRRLITLRTFLLPLVGLALFVFYEVSFCYLFDVPMSHITDRIQSQLESVTFASVSRPLLPQIACGVSTLLYVVAVYFMIRNLYKKNILLRKKCVLLFFLSLFFLLLILFTPSDNYIPLFAFWSVLVLILCEEETFVKNNFFYNIMFLILWIIGIISCFNVVL